MPGFRGLSWLFRDAVRTRCEQDAFPDTALIRGVKLNEGFVEVRGCQRVATFGVLIRASCTSQVLNYAAFAYTF